MLNTTGADRATTSVERSKAMSWQSSTSWRDRRKRRDRRRRTRARTAAVVLGAATAAVSTSVARADIVAAWSFNGVEPQGIIASDIGDGWIDLAEVGGEADLFSGTLENAPADWMAGEALGLRGTAAGGSLLLFAPVEPSFGGGGYEVSVSFATRRSATGFTDLRLDHWTDGAWTTVDTVTVDADWSISRTTFELSNWATGVQLRLVPMGATAGAGTLRFDNVIVDVAMVPAPGPVAVGLIATGVMRGRRRGRLAAASRGWGPRGGGMLDHGRR